MAARSPSSSLRSAMRRWGRLLTHSQPLGGTVEVAAVAKSYKAFVQRVPLDSGDYTMDHTAIVYMMDRNGRFFGSLDRHETEGVHQTPAPDRWMRV